MSGTLYVVATPLGNLGDLSVRAAETLGLVTVVAAEDTRRTRRLLSHLGVSPRLISLPAFAEADKAGKVLALVEQGAEVAFVTDAGTPGVSDPGTMLVAEAKARGLSVVPIPGPSAVATALSASGLPADRYLFLGFLPRKGTHRRELIKMIAESSWTVVVFESPNRLEALLSDLVAALGEERRATVARELTKMYEDIRLGSLGELLAHYAEAGVKGEVTVAIAGAPQKRAEPDRDEVARVAADLAARGLSTKEIVRELTESHGISRNEGYRLVMGLS